MEFLATLLDIVLHLDTHLLALVQDYGVWVYAILFAIIFAETGLVIAPFLPGDSLLFVIGALCGMGSLQLEVAMPLLILAAFMGDNTNYWIGRLLGLRLLERFGSRLIKHEHLEKTHAFYEKHGGKTIIIARFMPIIRTFAPFVAGIGEMYGGIKAGAPPEKMLLHGNYKKEDVKELVAKNLRGEINERLIKDEFLE